VEPPPFTRSAAARRSTSSSRSAPHQPVRPRRVGAETEEDF